MDGHGNVNHHTDGRFQYGGFFLKIYISLKVIVKVKFYCHGNIIDFKWVKQEFSMPHTNKVENL